MCVCVGGGGPCAFVCVDVHVCECETMTEQHVTLMVFRQFCNKAAKKSTQMSHYSWAAIKMLTGIPADIVTMKTIYTTDGFDKPFIENRLAKCTEQRSQYELHDIVVSY